LTIASNTGKTKFKFCFATAYSESQFNFGLFKSTIIIAILCNIPIMVATTNSAIKVITGKFKRYSAIPNVIMIVTIFIIIFGIILYIYCLYSDTGIYFINTAFSPSLEIAVIEIYINIVKNCITPKMIQAIKNVFVGICCNIRSEEHTSELQSRFDLVCRLLLEK